MIYVCSYDSPIGRFLLASDGVYLIGLWMESQRYFGSDIHEEVTKKSDLAVFCRTKKWLNQYFAGECSSCEGIPVCPRGSEFQQLVWQILREIPYGEVRTYGDIAKEVAKRMGKEKMSSQAVGNAVGRNPISILIPCHRVVGQKGNLVGYGGGIQRKIYLLHLEGIDLSTYYIPKNCSFL